MSDGPLILHQVGAVRDAQHVSARPGALAIRGNQIIAAGAPDEVRRIAGKPDRIIDQPDLLILPGLVNAHAHLDLTSLGARPYGGAFIDWVSMVMRDRPRDEAAIRAAVLQGMKLSRDAGTAMLGDIAAIPAAIHERVHAPMDHWLGGISWLECFGLGEDQKERGIEALANVTKLTEDFQTDEQHRVHIDLQPHAPYSAGLALYGVSSQHWRGRTSTHLAETREEIEFIRDATGPFADLLKRLGKWSDRIHPTGKTPIQYLNAALGHGQWTLAHCNYVTNEDLNILSNRRDTISIAYCPIASDYFHHTGHRYREMIDAKINVCLGTDSILCQPADEPQPMSILAQMRHLYRRDQTDPALLLTMATVNGARALTGEPERATLSARGSTNVAVMRFDPDDATDALEQVLRSREMVMTSAIQGV